MVNPEVVRRILGNIFVALDLGLLALVAIAFLGRYVDPRSAWWTQVFAEGLPILTLMLAASTVLIAVRGPSILVWLHLGVLSAVLIRDVTVRAGPRDTFEESPALTVMTLNAKPKYDAPGTALLELFERESADIVALQEVSFYYAKDPRSISIPRHLWGVLGPYRSVRPKSAFQDPLIQNGLPVLIRLPDGRLELIELTTDRGQSVRMSRAELVAAGRDISVFNVHLKSYDDLAPRIRGGPWQLLKNWIDQLHRIRGNVLDRAAEARAIRVYLDTVKTPHVVLGDFNCSPNSWAYQHLSRNLKTARPSVIPFAAATYHSKWPLFQIDHILVSNHWRVLDARTVSTGFSDHRAVVADLVLSDKP